MNEILAAQQWRYAVKKFDAQKKISAQDWKQLAQCLILTPSSYGLQPWKFIVVTSDDLKAELTAHSWKQTQVADCSHYVVFCSFKKMTEDYIHQFVADSASKRGTPIESLAAYEKMMVGDLVKGGRSAVIGEWAARQCYIALGNLMTSAALMKIDSCPMEGIIPAKYDEVLKLTQSPYQTVMACALGYRSPEDKYQHALKVRFDENQLIELR